MTRESLITILLISWRFSKYVMWATSGDKNAKKMLFTRLTEASAVAKEAKE
jgi:hypothetical protein